jgi:hypothetical protein
VTYVKRGIGVQLLRGLMYIQPVLDAAISTMVDAAIMLIE